MPLGGPSFAGLISEAARIKMAGIYPADKQSWAHAVQRVYESGIPTARRPLDDKGGPRERGAELWRDPEEFLELVGLSRENAKGLLADLIANLVWRKAPSDTYEQSGYLTDELRKKFLGDLSREATRFCAAACSSFLADAESDPTTMLKTEKWEPYVRWKRELLAPGDAVVTFNWDRVLDLLNNKGGPELVPELPGGSSAATSDVPVFQMHGHVGWQRDGNNPSVIYEKKDHLAAVKYPDSAVLGTPGILKKATAEGELASVWQSALHKLRNANKVVIIGYRFPPSDNMSKRALLGALKASDVTRIHVVLGPKSEDTPRLRGLLNWTDNENGPPRQATVHEMGAEDFLAVVEKRHL
jgi:hypothetical protein